MGRQFRALVQREAPAWLDPVPPDGLLRVAAPGLYTLELTSDDGSRLSLAGEPILDNGGLQGAATRTARVLLPAGRIPLRIDWFDAGGAASLSLHIAGPEGWSLTTPLPRTATPSAH